MSVLYIALPVALLLALIAVIAFAVQVRGGQFDDLETPPRRMLFDDVELKRKPEKHKPEKLDDDSDQASSSVK